MSEELPAALTAFGEGPPEIDVARALRGHDKGELLSLVAHLETFRKRAHLEALGEAGLGKEIKKAARKAAYKLKSAGVDGEATGRAAVDLSTSVDLSQVAVMTGLGLRGTAFAILGTLPGVDSVMIDVREGGSTISAEIIRSVGGSRLRGIARELAQDDASGVLGGAALAVRTIDAVERAIRGGSGRFPSEWQAVRIWRQRAVALGADPAAASARTLLASDLRDPQVSLQRTTEKALDAVEAGDLRPPAQVIDAFLRQLEGAIASPIDLTEALFHGRVDGLIAAAADAWLAGEANRGIVADRLEHCADVTLSAGHGEHALRFLLAADQLAGGEVMPHEVGLVAGSFRSLFESDRLYRAYVEQRFGAKAAADLEERDDDGGEEGGSGLILP